MSLYYLFLIEIFRLVLHSSQVLRQRQAETGRIRQTETETEIEIDTDMNQ